MIIKKSNGENLTAEELVFLYEKQKKPTQKKETSTPVFIKVWLLVLLSLVVVSGIVFAFLEYSQSQQIIDVGANWLNKR